MENGIVFDEDVLAGAMLERLGTGATLHADTVIPHIHRIVHDQDVLALADVDAVAVLRIPRAAHVHAVDDDFPATLGNQMELRGILDGHALDQQPLAVGEPDEVRTHLLLGCIGIGDVVKCLQIKRIPEITLGGDGSAHPLESVPFRVADFRPLHAAPPFAVSVDDSFTGDADVRPLAGGNARYSLPVLEVRRPVRCQEDHGILFQVQVDTAFQGDGTGEPDSRRHDQMAASLLVQGADCLREGLRVVGHAIAHGTKVRQRHGVFGDGGQSRFHHFHRQILVILLIGARPERAGKQGHQHAGKKQLLHCQFVTLAIFR